MKYVLLLLPVVALAAPVTNPQVTPGNIQQTICVPGWTKTVRPPVSYTNRIKRDLLESGELSDYELDHLTPIELGGHPRDPDNLWMQPWEGKCGARKKDVLETKLKRLVCANEVRLRDAQNAINSDWVKAYNRWIGPLECDE
ncbi:hypothetical protein UFOVP254_20 [uncultured Caudovirales phage]|uniref:HNHc domain containing protein n=1 Tax=uncultured Caudovirales phage TaxID=2100421 RepID=A0A6J5L156_9CAUD|nr:hypothetical protein UFOVP76_33 [uncultured Caudovirales phage]CAB4132950.1 hypothetical protein UFOVP254_20 [uncultured Caudovirales phage]